MTDYSAKFEEAGKLFFEDENRPIVKIYVDLEYLQDFRFGALLTSITIKEEMKYVMARLAQYNQRYHQATATYFSALKLTDTTLDGWIKGKQSDRIILTAPFTSVYYDFISLLRLINTHNTNVCDTLPKLRISINATDVVYPEAYKVALTGAIKAGIDNVAVEFTIEPRYKASAAMYLEYDLMFLYDYGQFISETSTTMKPFIADGKFENKKIMAHPYIDPKLNHPKEDYDYILQSTEAGLNMFCDFMFLPSKILLQGAK